MDSIVVIALKGHKKKYPLVIIVGLKMGHTQFSVGW